MMAQRFSSTEHAQLEASLRRVQSDSRRFMDLFYDRLFDGHPDMRPLFQSPMERQKRRFLASLSVFVRGLRDPQQIAAMLCGLATLHTKYGVDRGQYPIVGRNLVATLAEFSGSDWSQDLEDLWERTYTTLQEGIYKALDEQDRSAQAPDVAPAESEPELEGRDSFDLAGEYLELCRRKRDGPHPLTPDEQERFRWLSWRLDTIPSHGETRHCFLRVSTQLVVHFTRDGTRYSGLITDISEEGFFIATDRPWQPPERLELEIQQGAGMPDVQIEARVVWVRHDATNEGPAGMGMHLEPMDVLRRSEVASLVQHPLLERLTRRFGADGGAAPT